MSHSNLINDLINDVLDYIFEHELEDFRENPDMRHVYFKAYAAHYGMKQAKKMLNETVSKLNEQGISK